jgi:hypothetical protein
VCDWCCGGGLCASSQVLVFLQLSWDAFVFRGRLGCPATRLAGSASPLSLPPPPAPSPQIGPDAALAALRKHAEREGADAEEYDAEDEEALQAMLLARAGFVRRLHDGDGEEDEAILLLLRRVGEEEGGVGRSMRMLKSDRLGVSLQDHACTKIQARRTCDERGNDSSESSRRERVLCLSPHDTRSDLHASSCSRSRHDMKSHKDPNSHNHHAR